MMRVRVLRIRPEHLPRFRDWMATLADRKDEVRQTLENEGVREEHVQLVETSDGPLVVYSVEAEDMDAALEAYRLSTLPIDAEHKEIMSTVVAEEVATEVLFHLTAGERP